MKPRINLWLEHDGQVALSAWRVRLLEAIAETGSISAAAQRLKVPYRRAWEKIQEMEAALGEKLVETVVGGAHGGGAVLTGAGRAHVEKFRKFSEGLEAEIQSRFEEVFR